MAEQINIKALLNTTQVEGSLTEMKQKFAELEDVLGSNLLSPQETQQVLVRMGQIKGEITELETQVDSLASTNAFDELVTLTTPLVGAITAVGSATQLLGVENEKVNEIIQRTTELTIGLSSLREIASAKAIKNIILTRAAQLKAYAVDKLTFDLTKKQTAANVAEAASKSKVTKVTKIATKAQLLWNKAVKANPILIIVAAVAALAAGIYALNKRLGDNTDELDENARAIDGVYIQNEKLREQYNEDIEALELLNLEYLHLTGRLSDYEYGLKKVNIETERKLELARQERDQQIQEVYDNAIDMWDRLEVRITSMWKGQAKALADVTKRAYEDSANEIEEIMKTFNVREKRYKQEQENIKQNLEEKRLAEIERQKEKALRADKERHEERMKMLNERYEKTRDDVDELDKRVNELSSELEIDISLGDSIFNDFNDLSNTYEDQIDSLFDNKVINNYIKNLKKGLEETLDTIDKQKIRSLEQQQNLIKEYGEAETEEQRKRIEKTIELKQEEVNKLVELEDLLQEEKIKKIDEANQKHRKLRTEYSQEINKIHIESSRERMDMLIRNEENLQGNLTQISLKKIKERHKEELELLKENIKREYILRMAILNEEGGKLNFLKVKLLKQQMQNEMESMDEEFKNRFDNIEDNVRSSIAELGGMVGDTLGDIFSRDISNKFDMLNYQLQNQIEKSREDLDSLREQDLISEEQYNQRMEKLDQEASEEELQLKREQARAEKRLALFQIAIDTAVGIAKSYGQGGGLFGAPLSAIVAAQGALQAALVASQPLPEFEEGGLVEGPSHDNGGVPVEMEGNEYVIRKDVVSQPGMKSMLDSINNSSVDRTPYTRDNDFVKEIKDAVMSVTKIPVVNVESDYSGVQRKVKSMESRASF